MNTDEDKRRLPRLPNVAQLTPYVTRLLAQNPGSFTLQGTNTYLIGAPDTRERILIDTGIGLSSYRELLFSYLEEKELQLVAVLVTHWHIDHWGGLDSILEVTPGLKLFKYKLETPLEEYEKRFNFTHTGDQNVIEIAGVHLTTLFLPGHCDDHICLWLNEEDILFSADNVLGHGSTIFNDYQRYMRSLYQMLALPRLGVVFPGHGEVIADGPAKITAYIEHRKGREEELLRLLKESDTPLSGTQLMLRVYTDIRSKPVRIMKAALNNTNQYLAQLRRDRRAQSSPEGLWTAVTEHSPSARSGL